MGPALLRGILVLEKRSSLHLPPGAFDRADEAPDTSFYRTARLVTHIDAAAIQAVTQLYREHFPPGGTILDLMSSWVSHLPPDVTYARVVGLGMNQDELASNPRLTEYRVHDLNAEPHLPYADGEFDGAAICVSIQYLTQPVEVLREVGRVLRPSASVVITFSNRCFPTKAVRVWQLRDDAGHRQLVESYLRAAGSWTEITSLDRTPASGGDPLFAVTARRT